MEVVPSSPAAPAPPAIPAEPSAPLSAAHAAVATDNVPAYREARLAERIGKPLPSVTPKAEAAPAQAVADPADTEKEPSAAAAQPERTISKRQQQINDYERRIAELEQRLSRTETAPRQDAQPAAEPPVAGDKPWKKYVSHPDYPKLADFDSIEEHAAAASLFIADQREAERTQTARQAAVQQTLQDLGTKYVERLQKAKEADPDLINQIPAELVHVRPLSGLGPDEKATIGNVAMEAAFRSDDPVAFLKHLKTHPEDIAAIKKAPQSEWLGRFRALAERVATPAPATTAAEPVPPPKTLTSAPEPAQVLGSRPAQATDPAAAAVASNDVRRYREARLAARAAQRR